MPQKAQQEKLAIDPIGNAAVSISKMRIPAA